MMPAARTRPTRGAVARSSGVARLCGLALFSALAVSGPSAALSEPAPVAAPAEAEAGSTAAPAVAKDRFEAAERLEELRYRHLWIAYGLIWLLVFVFVFRTWSRGQGTDKELRALESRMKELEDGRSGHLG